MNKGGLIWCIFFILLGIGWTLENFNIIHVSTIDILVKFWPLILIGIGGNIILKNRKKWYINIEKDDIIRFSVKIYIINK